MTPVQYQYVFPNPSNRILHLPEFAPDPAPIVGVWLFAQNPIEGFPADAYGHITVAVDPGSRYSNSAGYPSNQFEEPYYLKTIGVMETRPNWGLMQRTEHQHPIRYSSGDCIVFASEIYNVPNILLYMGIVWQQEGDIPNQAGTLLFSTILDSVIDRSNGIAMRNIIPANGVACNEVRVCISSLGFYYSAGHISIGVRDGGTPNMRALPVELLFGTQPGFLLAPFSRRWSNWVPLIKGKTDDLLINIDMFYPDPDDNKWVYGNNGGGGYYSFGVPSSFLMNMGGTPVYQPNRSYIVSGVEIR